MKNSIWDILTGITLFGILCLIGVFALVLANPAVAFNPFRPPDLVPTIAFPTPPTATVGLPATWTPTPPDSKPVEAVATLRPSSTPLPTATRVVLPTFTPSKAVPVVTRVGGTRGGNCSVIYQSPPDATQFKPNESIGDIRWTIKNTSSETWRADSIDIRYISGNRLNVSSSLLDLPYDVPAGSAVDVIVKGAVAPSSAGTYDSNWSLSAGSSSVCRFFLEIEVK